MKQYHVTWKIDLYADSPREAARRALAIHRDPDSIATAFDVADETGHTERVDVEEFEPTMKKNPRCFELRRRVRAGVNAWRKELRHRNPPAYTLLQRKDLGALCLTLEAELSEATRAASPAQEPNEAVCGCGVIVTANDPYFATPCGTFCGNCMRQHAKACGVCAYEFGLRGAKR